MGLINIVGFETADLKECSNSGGTVSVQNTTARNSGYALRCNPTTTAVGWAEIRGVDSAGDEALANVATSYFTFWFQAKFVGSSDEPIFRLLNTSSALKCRIHFDGGRLVFYDSAGTSVASGAFSLSYDTWYKLNIKISTGSSASWEILLNGAAYLSGTDNLGTVNAGSVRLGKSTNQRSFSVDYYFDDFAWSDSAYPAGDRVVDLLPNAAGNYQQWDIEDTDTGSHWGQLTERPTGTVSSLRQNATPPCLETNAVASLPTTPGTIYAVKPWITGIRGGGANRTGNLMIRVNSTDYQEPDITFSGSEKFMSIMHETNPVSAAAWTNSDIDTLEVGARRNAGSATIQMRDAGAMVYYSEAVASATPKTLMLMGVGV